MTTNQSFKLLTDDPLFDSLDSEQSVHEIVKAIALEGAEWGSIYDDHVCTEDNESYFECAVEVDMDRIIAMERGEFDYDWA